MTSHKLREQYLNFFKTRGHAVLPSAPLVPENDPTTLFTGSGMQPLVPFLLGEKHPDGTRLVNSQRCFRAVDMEEVGDNRHTTFFEMLGNWSLGDYFKKEQIPWVFEFLTKEVGLDPKRLYVTVFGGNAEIGIPRDDESVQIWKSIYTAAGIDATAYDDAEAKGMRDGRIFYYDEQKNWWSRSGVPANMPVGEPGGPDTEVFWDFDPEEKLGLHQQWIERQQHPHFPRTSQRTNDSPCHVNCDCGRFLEIANSVFMQYQRAEQGFQELPQKNVDFGGGLERIAAAYADTPDIFMIDLFQKAREILERSSGKRYGQQLQQTRAFRVIMDHLRAATFLIVDGALPSNKDQGYFTRRLMRRAIRYAETLGLRPGFCSDVANAFIEEYAPSMPSLSPKQSDIAMMMRAEEEKFRKTLELGLKMFASTALNVPSGEMLPDKDAFDLYQSYGFPIEMTQELAAERGIMVDRAAFALRLKNHRELSRTGAQEKFHGGLADHAVDTVRLHTANHMLLESLKRVLGRDVNQKGSNITSERLRLDFNYPEKLTTQQITQIEDLTNEHLAKDLPVHYEAMPLEQAREENATGVFDERYSERVKVYKVGHAGAYYSVEICGGPHVRHTGQVGRLKIIKEEAVSAGVRRIKAVVEGGAPLAQGEQAQEQYPQRG